VSLWDGAALTFPLEKSLQCRPPGPPWVCDTLSRIRNSPTPDRDLAVRATNTRSYQGTEPRAPCLVFSPACDCTHEPGCLSALCKLARTETDRCATPPCKPQLFVYNALSNVLQFRDEAKLKEGDDCRRPPAPMARLHLLYPIAESLHLNLRTMFVLRSQRCLSSLPIPLFSPLRFPHL
jgi:hypothetical protein